MQENNTGGYKQTPIGLIPTDWEVKKLGEIATVKGRIGYRGYTTDDIVKPSEGAITISPSNIFENQFNFDFCTYISWFKYEESPEIQIKPNDILLVKTGSTFGKTALVKYLPEKATINPQLVVIKEVKCDIVYLSYMMADSIFQKQINATVVGGAIPTLSQENILSFPIPIPPLPEQQKIATILSTWDAAIDNCKAIIQKLQQRNKGLAQQLLTGKMRVKGFEETKWYEKRLGDVFKERNESNQNSLQLLSIGERGVYPQDEDNKRDISNSDKSKYKKICIGDIGYNTMRMWQGRCAKSSYEGIVSPAYTIVFCKPNHFVNFYAYLFKQPFMMHKFLRVSQGLVEDTLNCKYKDFSIVPVNIPNDIEEQKAIANILDIAAAELNQYHHQLQVLHQQKKGLMQQLLTGKVRVKI